MTGTPETWDDVGCLRLQVDCVSKKVCQNDSQVQKLRDEITHSHAVMTTLIHTQEREQKKDRCQMKVWIMITAILLGFSLSLQIFSKSNGQQYEAFLDESDGGEVDSDEAKQSKLVKSIMGGSSGVVLKVRKAYLEDLLKGVMSDEVRKKRLDDVDASKGITSAPPTQANKDNQSVDVSAEMSRIENEHWDAMKQADFTTAIPKATDLSSAKAKQTPISPEASSGSTILSKAPIKTKQTEAESFEKTLKAAEDLVLRAAKDLEVLRAAPKSFEKILKAWEDLVPKAAKLLLQPGDASNETEAKALAKQASAVHQKLYSEVKEASKSAALMSIAQNRISAVLARQATAIERSIEPFEGCSSKEDGIHDAESRCYCLVDNICAHASTEKRVLCSLVSQTACTGGPQTLAEELEMKRI